MLYSDINDFLKCKSILGASSIEEMGLLLKKRYPIFTKDFDPNDLTKQNIKHWFSFSENRKINPFFKYNKNSLGFRDKEIVLDADLLCVGCSVSYGVGVPEEYRWSNIVSNNLNLTFNNLSIPGNSSFEISLLTVSFLKFLNPKYILIFLPECFRTCIPKINEDNSIEYTQIFNNYEIYVNDKSSLDYSISKNYYSLPITYSLDKFRSIMQLLFLISKLKNIQVYIGSWHKTSIEFINNFKDNATTIEYEPQDNRGRDISHPGILFHAKVANKFIKVLENDIKGN